MKRASENIDWADDFRDLSDLHPSDEQVMHSKGLRLPLIDVEAVHELAEGIDDLPIGRPGTLRPTPVSDGGLEIHGSSPEDLAQL